MPSHIKLRFSPSKYQRGYDSRKKKGKSKEGENEVRNETLNETSDKLSTLDIFAGCGGMSEGLRKSGKFDFLVLFFFVVKSSQYLKYDTIIISYRRLSYEVGYRV